MNIRDLHAQYTPERSIFKRTQSAHRAMTDNASQRIELAPQVCVLLMHCNKVLLHKR